MLYTDRQQSIGIQLKRVAISVQGFGPDSFRAGHLLENSGYRQAPLFRLLFAIAFDNLRINQHQRLILLFGDIDYHQPLRNIDLGGGEADTRRLIHGIKHVIHQAAQSVIHLLNRLRLIA